MITYWCFILGLGFMSSKHLLIYVETPAPISKTTSIDYSTTTHGSTYRRFKSWSTNSKLKIYSWGHLGQEGEIVKWWFRINPAVCNSATSQVHYIRSPEYYNSNFVFFIPKSINSSFYIFVNIFHCFNLNITNFLQESMHKKKWKMYVYLVPLWYYWTVLLS